MISPSEHTDLYAYDQEDYGGHYAYDEFEDNAEFLGEGLGSPPPEGANHEEDAAPEEPSVPIPVAKLIGKPQVWIRIRPTPSFDNNVFEIAEDKKTLKLMVQPEDRLFQKKTGKTNFFTFGTDGILQNSSQEETFQATVLDVVEKAMEGVSGAVVCVGPEISGKSFTLFGPQTKYQFRGVLPRALDRIFELVEERKEDYEYHIVFSMFEIRKDKIKDLLTLGPYELKRVGDYGPKGLFYEEITSMEHALNLMLRGITGQKQIPREPYAKYHTVVYVDIIARPLKTDQNEQEWRSRITFAKIASMPNREKQKKFPLPDPPADCGCPETCYETKKKVKEDEIAQSGKCCRGPQGNLAESISIRKDMSFLEQMFIRAHDLRKIYEYYSKLESMGMYMLMKPPKLAPSQYFRQSKLAHCLKDIVSGKTEIRVILHVRPERSYIQSTLEAMRFAERARCIPCNPVKKNETIPGQTFEQHIAHMCSQLGIPDTFPSEGKKGSIDLSELYSQINPEKMREILSKATTYFEEKLDTLEGTCKDQVKVMFESFRDMWSHMLEKGISDEQNHRREEEAELPGEDATPMEVVSSTQTEDLPMFDEHDHPHSHEKRKSSSTSKKKTPNNKPEENLKANKDHKKSKKNRKSSTKVKGKDGHRHEHKLKESDQDESQLDIDGNKHRQSLDNEESHSHVNSSTADSEVVTANETSAERKSDDYSQKSVGAIAANVLITVGNEDFPVERISGSVEMVKAVSITAEPIVVQIPDANGNEIQFKHDAWEAFSKSSQGQPLLTDFQEKQTILRQCIMDHNETQKDFSNLLAGLTKLEIDMDIMEQEKSLQGNVVGLNAPAHEIQTMQTCRDELVIRLKDLRAQLQAQKQLVKDSKKECEHAFQAFCSETYARTLDTRGLPLSTLDHAMATTAQEALGFPVLEKDISDDQDGLMNLAASMKSDEKEAEMSKHFDALKKMAKQQAETLLSAYPKRPPWTMYY